MASYPAPAAAFISQDPHMFHLLHKSSALHLRLQSQPMWGTVDWYQKADWSAKRWEASEDSHMRAVALMFYESSQKQKMRLGAPSVLNSTYTVLKESCNEEKETSQSGPWDSLLSTIRCVKLCGFCPVSTTMTFELNYVQCWSQNVTALADVTQTLASVRCAFLSGETKTPWQARSY